MHVFSLFESNVIVMHHCKRKTKYLHPSLANSKQRLANPVPQCSQLRRTDVVLSMSSSVICTTQYMHALSGFTYFRQFRLLQPAILPSRVELSVGCKLATACGVCEGTRGLEAVKPCLLCRCLRAQGCSARVGKTQGASCRQKWRSDRLEIMTPL